VIDEAITVRVKRLGERGLELVCDESKLEPMMDVKIRLRDSDFQPSGWYGRVQAVRAHGEGDEQTCAVFFTHEAEPTLAERLRQRLAQSLGESADAGAQARVASHAQFLRQIERAPLVTPGDQAIATQILVEMAFADGMFVDSEREFIHHFVEADGTTISALAARDPLSATELDLASPGPTRDTMLMLAWAMALCDSVLAESEVARLAEFADGLGISADRAFELRAAAQHFLAESAYSIIWPAGSDAGAGEVIDLARELDEMVEQWVPGYGAYFAALLGHLPRDFRPAEVLVLGGGAARVVQELRARFPEAVIQQVDDDIPDGVGAFDLVVANLALHHLDATQRGTLAKQIAVALRDGGIFAYADVFIAEFESVDELAEWRRAALALGRPTTDPQPDTVGDACVALAEAGFAHVDCAYRSAIWGVLLAQKSQ